MQNRLRWHLHELGPELEPPPVLDRICPLDRLTAWLAGQPAGMVVRLDAELVDDIRTATQRINALEQEIAARVQAVAPALLALAGCGPLTAARSVKASGLPRPAGRLAGGPG